MSDSPLQRANRSLTLKLCGFTLGAFAFGFALVPLYDVVCEITGIGNQKSLLRAATLDADSVAEDRTVTVEFVSSLPTVGNWEFRPVVASMQVQPGRLYEAHYIARNLTGHDTVAQAVPDVAPGMAAAWFHKTECFCFTPQSFKSNEQRVMPVRFFVDRALPKNIDRLTLSYTFYDEFTRIASRNP